MAHKTRKAKFSLRRKANQVARSIHKTLVKTEKRVAKQFKKFMKASKGRKGTRGGRRRKSRSNMFIDPHAFNIIY